MIDFELEPDKRTVDFKWNMSFRIMSNILPIIRLHHYLRLLFQYTKCILLYYNILIQLVSLI